MTRFSLAAVALAALTLAACDSNEPIDRTPVSLNVQTATDVVADPTNGRDSLGNPIATGRFTLYSLAENRVVLSYTETDSTARAAVTNSTAWDVGFQGQRIIFNGGASGPGAAVAQLVNTPFDLLTEAPATGYLADGANAACTTGGLVLCPVTGDDDAWYTYVLFVPGDQQQGGFLSPRAGYSIVLRLADGETYAKLRIKSYYQGSLADGQIVPTSRGRYYTFDFVTQPDGSRSFTTTPS